jgi:hypothetical protein
MIRKRLRNGHASQRKVKVLSKAATARSPIVLAEREASKPIGVRSDTGAFVTLGEYVTEPRLAARMASLSSLGYERLAEFTVARLEKEPSELRVGILGRDELSRDEIISEVRQGSAIGKQFVQIERAWVERLKEKLSRGEYKLRAQAPEASKASASSH